MSDDDEDIMVVKKKQREIKAEAKKVSVKNKKLRKIKPEGHFGGDNLELLDAEGKPMERLDYLKQEA